MKPFEKPIYVTRPMLANLDDVNKEFYEIWQSQWLTNGGAKHQKLEEELKKVQWRNCFDCFNPEPAAFRGSYNDTLYLSRNAACPCLE